MELIIRQGTVQDAPGIVQLINSVIEEGNLISIYPPLTVAQEEKSIQELGQRGAVLLAEMDHMVVGLQIIEPFARHTQAMDHIALSSTFVYRNFRKRGIGRQLMSAALDLARQKGYEKIITFVRVGNAVGQSFYRKLGFVPKMMLERQVKIGGKYDDEIWMDLFVPQLEKPVAEAKPAVQVAPPPVQPQPVKPEAVEPVVAPRPAAVEARPQPAVRAEPVAMPTVAQPTVPAQAEIDQQVGAVTVRRAKRGDLKTLTAIMKGSIRWRPSPTEDQVLEMLYDKGYWLAMSRKGGGVTGWRAENLVMCIDDFYVYPSQFYTPIGGPLLETVEEEAKALTCEVAIVFLEHQIAPEAIEFFKSRGYEQQELDQLFTIWKQVASEFMTGGCFMMVKKLREKRIMRPI